MNNLPKEVDHRGRNTKRVLLHVHYGLLSRGVFQNPPLLVCSWVRATFLCMCRSVWVDGRSFPLPLLPVYPIRCKSIATHHCCCPFKMLNLWSMVEVNHFFISSEFLESYLKEKLTFTLLDSAIDIQILFLYHSPSNTHRCRHTHTHAHRESSISIIFLRLWLVQKLIVYSPWKNSINK